MDNTIHAGNLLGGQESLYLQQHAHNPVFWYPYGPLAFERAMKEAKLMIISIGYSACHWCHVMEHETFMDVDAAALMNEFFICVKVDREEMPDVDAYYMESMQLLGIRGGWPLNCIATPEGKAIFGGTYFAKRQWMSLLNEVQRVFLQEPELIYEQSDKIFRELEKSYRPVRTEHISPEELTFSEVFISKLTVAFDRTDGGLFGAPKFAITPMLMFCNHLAADGNDDIAGLLRTTYEKMALGGIYDQIGGGFARYATDERWAVPHFEKMLYDNAQLLGAYSQAFRVFGKRFYLEILEGIHGFLEEWMKHPRGGYFAAVDADSDGAEGAYYTWTMEAFQQILGEHAGMFSDFFDLQEKGKWENGRCILQKKYAEDDVFAAKYGISPTAFKKLKKQSIEKLLSNRKNRISPLIDRKVIVSWNALLITGWVDAWKATRTEKYRESADSLGRVLLKHAFRPDGLLMHCYYGEKSTGTGFLEDYAFLAKALLDLYEITGDGCFLAKAGQLLEDALAGFSHSPGVLYRFTHNAGNTVPVARVEETDMVMPSSNSMLCRAFVKYGKICGEEKYLSLARQMLMAVSDKMNTTPTAYGNWGLALAEIQEPWFVVRISGEKYDDFAGILYSRFHHHIVMPEATSGLLQSGAIQICGARGCLAPVYSVQDAIERLDSKTV
jgi:hypothetical protein